MIITRVNTETLIVARANKPPDRFLVLPALHSTFPWPAETFSASIFSLPISLSNTLKTTFQIIFPHAYPTLFSFALSTHNQLSPIKAFYLTRPTLPQWYYLHSHTLKVANLETGVALPNPLHFFRIAEMRVTLYIASTLRPHSVASCDTQA